MKSVNVMICLAATLLVLGSVGTAQASFELYGSNFGQGYVNSYDITDSVATQQTHPTVDVPDAGSGGVAAYGAYFYVGRWDTATYKIERYLRSNSSYVDDFVSDLGAGPWGMNVDSSGNIYVGLNSGDVRKYNPGGGLVWSANPSGAFVADVVIDEVNGFVYAGTNNQLYALNTADGSTWDSGTGFIQGGAYAGLALDSRGDIWMSNDGTNNVFFVAGAHRTNVGAYQQVASGLNVCSDVAFGPDGMLYVGLQGAGGGVIRYNVTLPTDPENPTDAAIAMDGSFGITTTTANGFFKIFIASIITPPLLPDDFEAYVESSSDPHDIVLGDYWSSTGTISLETTEVHGGLQSLKAVLSAAGTVTKATDPNYNYAGQDGKEVVLWFKGDVSNDTGAVTLKILDVENNVIASGTFVNGTTQADWVAVKVAVDAVAQPNWAQAQSVQIDVGAAGTMYFDDLEFGIPDQPAQLVVHWKLDENSGLTAADSSGNNINGALKSPPFTGAEWVAGNDGNALQFGSDPNYNVDSGPVTAVLDPDIFRGNSSWTISQWIYLNEASSEEVFGGFGSGDSSGGAGSERYLISGPDNAIRFWGEQKNVTASATFDVGQWQMVTITYDRWTKTLRMYKNAVPVGAALGFGLFDTAARVQIAPVEGPKDPEGNSLGFTSPNGLIDDFRIYDQALSVQEVVTLYGQWICLPGSEPELDFNGDCRVDFIDFAQFAASWLEDTRVYP